MHRMAFGFLTILTIILLLVSCSSSDSPITAFDEPEKAVSSGGSNSHGLWGLWQFVADPETQTLEYFQLRVTEKPADRGYGGAHLSIVKASSLHA